MSAKSCILATCLLGSLALGSQTYDYVIVGGGTSGLVLANRLSEQPNATVAVIEAGSLQENNPNVTTWDSFLHTKGFNTSIDWLYTSASQQYASGRQLPYHAGKALGGTSTINGMTYIRGEKAQVDAWEAIGNQGWNWDALYPYYKKAEHFDNATQNQLAADGASFVSSYHGFDGFLHVGYPVELDNSSFHETVNATIQALGIPSSPDVNGGHVRGFTLWQSTWDRVADVRADAAREYYLPVQNRSNLHVFPSTLANKMVWSGSSAATASGVEITTSSNTTAVLAVNKEVIVCAGSLRSPAFLELSGIGNPDILSQYGIPVQVALPGVGENLQDQPNVVLAASANISFNGSGPYVAYANTHDIFGASTAAVANATQAQLKAWAATVAQANGGRVNASALERLFAVQHRLLFADDDDDAVPDAEIIVTATGAEIALPSWVLMPFSRGSVHIQSPLPALAPLIDPNFFVVDWDLTAQAAISRFARSVLYTSPMHALLLDEIVPGTAALPLNATDAEWAAFIKASFSPNYHPLGSASMMPRDLGGVVDPSLKVYGTSNVRVVDASIMPFQISGHLTSTLYAIAERAADLIKQAA